MSRIRDVEGAEALRRLYTPQVRPAGARIGVFSNANHWYNATIGQGYQLQNNRLIVTAWWRSADTVNSQSVFAFSDANSGWGLIGRLTHTINLFFFGPGAGSATLGDAYLGLNVTALWQDGAGQRWSSLNGGTVTAVDAAVGTYTPASATAVWSIGYSRGNANFAATQASVLWSAVIDDATMTAARVRAFSNARNLLDRWNCPPGIVSATGLQDLKRWALWDGASATFTDIGLQLTRAGTGGGKTTMPAYLRYRVPQNARRDNVLTNEMGSVGTPGLQGRCAFTTFSFSSSAADPSATGPAGVILDVGVSYYGATNESVIQAGLSVNGTNQAGNQAGANPTPGLFPPNGERLIQSVDMPGIAAGAAKTFVVTDGMRAKVLGEILSASSVEYVSVPQTQPLTFNTRAQPTQQVINLTDSIGQYIQGNSATDGVKGPVYQAWQMLERANFAASRVMALGWLSGTWAEQISTPAALANLLDQIYRGRGTTNNRLWCQLGTNDFSFSTYASLATFETELTAFVNGVLALGLAGLELRLVGPTQMAGEGVPNSGGWTLPQLRTSIQNVVTAIANPAVTYVNAGAAGFVTFPGNFGTDQKHLTVAGHAQYEASMRAVIGY